MSAPRAAAMPNDLSQRAHRRLIGVLGLLLPVLLYLVAGMRPTPPLPRWTLLHSVSAYYYTGAEGIFVGVLFALSLFLFSYPGYEGETADRLLGGLGGAAALGVALFPVPAPEGLPAPPWWRPGMEIVHHLSAITLFISFILFAVCLFRRSSVPKGERPLEKRVRDALCLVCGLIMIVCVAWAASSMITHAPIVIPEAIAIMMFAASWLIKGEAYEPALRAIRRLRS